MLLETTDEFFYEVCDWVEGRMHPALFSDQTLGLLSVTWSGQRVAIII